MPFVVPHAPKIAAPPSGIIRDGLLLRWIFDEGSGNTTADDSGNGHTGTLLDPTPGNWVSPGYGGVGYNYYQPFTGGPYVRNLTLNVNGNTAQSLCARIRRDGGTSAGGIVSTPNTTATSYGMYLHIPGVAETIEFGCKTAGKLAVNTYSAPGHRDGNWHSVIGVYDGADVILYYDGAEIGRDTGYSGGLSAAAGAFYAGRTSDTLAQGRDQNIDDVRVYDRGLTPVEVSQIAAGTG